MQQITDWLSAENGKPIIEAVRARGMTTLQAIADELTRQKWPTARGADAWSMMAVSNIMKRGKDGE